jgi:mono/diheme cytochrome c family protein
LGSLFSGTIANNILTLSSDNWTGEGNVISAEDGQPLYQTYCQPCHNENGQGHGPGVINLPSGSPAEFPADLPQAYIFWRAWEGVPETIMPPFNWLISEGDIWNITAYVQRLSAALQGGQE